MAALIKSVSFDCTDALAQAEFWAAVLGTDVDEDATAELAYVEAAGWEEIEVAKQVRMTGGVAAEKQIDLALFLASEQSNHISGRLIHVQDDWKKLKDKTINADLYRLRRVQKG